MNNTILLVEDRLDNRSSYTKWFEDESITVIGAGSKKSALGIYKSNPSHFNGVVTDIRLSENDQNDESGLELGREIHRLNPDLPIFGITAYDIDGFNEKKFDIFTKTYKKVSNITKHDFSENIDYIVKMISSYDHPHLLEASENLDRIREKYHISDGDFHSLLSNFPVSGKVEQILLNIHEFHDETSEGSEIKYEKSNLLLIEPLNKLGEKFNVKNPLPVVISEEKDGVFISEVLLMPTIYSYGDSVEESLENLLGSLVQYKREINESKKRHLDTIQFGKYLENIFHG